MGLPLQNNGIPLGQQTPNSNAGDYNNINFVIQQAIAKLQTSTLVKIISCTNNGELSPVGFVDVQPLVNQVDGEGKSIPHGIIYNIPYFRLQGGTNAFIIDPVIGDIGICLFANRDISNVKTTKAQANPGSYRTFNFADGLYIGGFLNAVPVQYVQMNAAGIKIHSPLTVTLDSPDISITCENLLMEASSNVTITTPTLNLNGVVMTTSGTNMNFNGDIVAGGISLRHHVHISEAPGVETSEPVNEI